MMGGDGTVWERNGRKLEDLCNAERTLHISELVDWARWVFVDGSVIVHCGTIWDIGMSPHCWCMRCAGHADDCEVRQ